MSNFSAGQQTEVVKSGKIEEADEVYEVNSRKPPLPR
jgi:hypothetical protein